MISKAIVVTKLLSVNEFLFVEDEIVKVATVLSGSKNPKAFKHVNDHDSHV